MRERHRVEAERTGLGALWVLVGAVVLCRVFVVRAVPIYDDAFITYRYAEHLAAGLGLVYNPGAPWEPVLGTTAPGYAVLLAGLVRLGADVVAASLAVNVVSDAVVAVLLARLLGRRALVTLVALLGYAALPQLARISAGGMESPLFLALVLGATLAASARSRGAPALAGALAALGCSLRPECVLLLAVLGVRFLAGGPREGRLRRLAVFAVPVALVGLAHAGLLTWIYGTPVPQSVAAKSTLPDPESPWYRVGIVLRESFWPLGTAMVLALPLVALGAFSSFARERATAPFSAFALLLVAAYAAAGPKTWGWYFFVPLSAWVLWLALGLETLLGWRPLVGAGRVLGSAAGPAALVLGPLAAASAALAAHLVPDRITPEVYARIEAWAEGADPRGRGERILASDIGAIGFLSGARVLDTEGLVWPEAIDFGQDQIAIVREHAPEWVFLVANHDRVPPFRRDPDLRARYRPAARFNAGGSSELEPDLDALPDRWVQDYLLYRRVDPDGRVDPGGSSR